VLNADDPQLRTRADAIERRFGDTHGWVGSHPIGSSGSSMISAKGCLNLRRTGRKNDLDLDGSQYDLGAVSAMPLSVDGTAVYNVANLAAPHWAAAALGNCAGDDRLGIHAVWIKPRDNPGRLMRFDVEE